MKRLLILAGMVIATCAVHAESRDPNSPYAPQQLKEMSTLVFEGAVVAIETNAEHKVSFPTKATVSAVMKGTLEAKELTFKHKNPGRAIIIEREYNTPTIGHTGTFYLEDQGGTLILIGYIKKIEPSSAGDTATNTLAGVVIEKRANVRSFESWNSPSDPYYVLDMGDVTETYVDGTNRWQEIRKQHVTLRPSDNVSTEKLSGIRGKQVQLRGRYVEGEPYKPADHAEQVPMEPKIRTTSDGTLDLVGSRPARRGSGFVVEEIVTQAETKKTPSQGPEELGRAVAACLISNDLASVRTRFTQPEAFFQKEMTNSWRRVREEVELRRIPWNKVEFKGVEIKKLATHGTSRVADIIMVFKVADDEFRIMLDEAYERDGRWYVFGFDWLGIDHIDYTTRGSGGL